MSSYIHIHIIQFITIQYITLENRMRVKYTNHNIIISLQFSIVTLDWIIQIIRKEIYHDALS